METAYRIYPNREKAFLMEVKRLKNWETSARNKELITRFQNFMFSKNTKQLRVSKLMAQLRRLALLLKKDFDKANITDIEGLLAYYNNEPNYSEATKSDYRRSIKQFYKWYKENDDRLESEDKKQLSDARKFYNYIEKNISLSYKLKQADFSEIIQDSDINKVIETGCKSIKEKAFLKVLHETGCRVGEFLNIKIKDIEISKSSINLAVDGKTGKRIVTIVNAKPYLIQWLDLHPFKGDKEAYLWIGESPRYMYEPIKHKGGQKVIDRCFNKAGMQSKKHNFHWFRHSRATILAPHFSEVILCKYMGWVLGSKQIKRYVHLCNQQVKDAVLSYNGMVVEQKQETEKPLICICGAVNVSFAKYCLKCGNPLKVEIAVRDSITLSNEIDDRLKIYNEIMQDPVKRAKYEEFKQLFLAQSK